MKFLFGMIKSIVLLVLVGIAAGRLFFPNLMQDKIINPVRKIPVFGQVLGLTWDKSGNLAPAITEKTVNLADKIEYSDLGISEAIEKTATDNNFSTDVTRTIEASIQKQMGQLENIPKEVLDKVETEIRNQLYTQICKSWIEASKSAVED